MSTDVGGMSGRLVEFSGALREHGVAVGSGETVDAARVMTALDLSRREELREGLASALLRRSGQRGVFDALFDLYFPAAVGRAHGAAAGSTNAEPSAPDDVGRLREDLAAALASGDEEELRRLATSAVEGLGMFGGGTGQGGWSAYQTLRRMQPENLLAKVLAGIRGAGQDGEAAFTDRLNRGEVERRISGFRSMVENEARRRTAELRGRERMARYGVQRSADQVDFLSARRDQYAELRRAVYPMARRLATRLAAKRRKSRRGGIELRRTLRRSLATGGVPVRPVYKTRRPGRPDLVLLCDVSGSVAGFADFTLMLVQALSDQFSRVRSFAFVETTDEVTDLIAPGAADPLGLAKRIISEARVTKWDGHSDYGNSLRVFTEEWPEVVGPRTSLLVLGDARTNGGDPELPVMHRLAERARHVHWLNPERRQLWATGDSCALDYARVVQMHECRNARQLQQVIAGILPV
ncbi:MAG: VWA domain-containing protein [Streptosporangiales bacterium]|nr:VWA domain-containing protein [Streptosporangiales bacterium]